MTKESQKEGFQIGFDDNNNPEIMVVQIPIGDYVRNDEDGDALLYGKLRKAEAVAFSVFNGLRKKSKANGIIRPTVQ